MATKLSGAVVVASQGLYSVSDTQYHDLGSTVFTNDGRAFRYGKAGGSDIKTGVLVQSAAEDTSDQNVGAAATAIGATSLVTADSITVTANQYAGGLAIVTTGPGIGRAYRISGHAAYTSAAATFALDDAIAGVALTTSSKIDLVANPYSAVIINPTTATSAPVGATVAGTVTAAYFAWFQVEGVSSVLADGALAVGMEVMASNGVAGAVEDYVTGSAGTQSVVGIAQTGVADTEVGAVFMHLL
jgi:hypothetical protein